MTDLRNKFLGYSPFRTKDIEVTVPTPDGVGEVVKLRVKQPSVEERQAILSESKVSKNGEVAMGAQFKMGALAIIYCVRDPETDAPVFTIADLDTIMHGPAGGWFDILARNALDILSDAGTEAKK